MDALPVEERPDYVLHAELQRAIAILCFTPNAGRYVQPHVPRLFSEAMMPARLFKKLKSKDTVVMRAVNTRLGIPRRTAAEARDDTTPSRYVGSFGTVYRHLQILAPTAEDRVEPPEGAPKEQRVKWEAWKLLEQHPPEELPPATKCYGARQGSFCPQQGHPANGLPPCSGACICRFMSGGQACTEQNRGGHYASTSVHAFRK